MGQRRSRFLVGEPTGPHGRDLPRWKLPSSCVPLTRCMGHARAVRVFGVGISLVAADNEFERDLAHFLQDATDVRLAFSAS